MYKHYARLGGLPLEGIDELDYSSSGVSRAGEGMGTSGTGTHNQNNSDTNMDNKSFEQRELVVDGGRIIDTETDKVVNLQDLDPETGQYKQG